MLLEKDIENLRRLFSIIIRDRLFPMPFFVWKQPYIDRSPSEWSFVIVSKLRTKIDYPFIKAYCVDSELLSLGVTEGEIDSHKVRIYDRDRTICDVLQHVKRSHF